MYVRMYVCMHACMRAYRYVCMFVFCMHAYIYVYMYVCMYVYNCLHIYISWEDRPTQTPPPGLVLLLLCQALGLGFNPAGDVSMHVHTYECSYVFTYVCMHVCMYACMYLCMYVCMYVCIIVYMYICIYEQCSTFCNLEMDASSNITFPLAKLCFIFRGTLA